MSVNESLNTSLKRMYRAKELAEVLGIGTSTIWKYTKAQKIKSHKISNGVTLFNIDEVCKDLGLDVNL